MCLRKVEFLLSIDEWLINFEILIIASKAIFSSIILLCDISNQATWQSIFDFY